MTDSTDTTVVENTVAQDLVVEITKNAITIVSSVVILAVADTVVTRARAALAQRKLNKTLTES